VPRRTTRPDAGAELRRWLIAEERELLTDVLTPIGWERGKPMENPPEPPNLDAVINEPGTFAWVISSQLRTLLDGSEYRLYRRDLYEGHPARRQGDLGDALILGADNVLRPA
jgi:hypothetical protein